MDINEEIQLVEKAKDSLEAFDRLYDYYLPKIYAFLLNRTASKEVAEDVTSQTFIKAMLKLKTFNFKGYRFGSWLYRIAHNTLIDYFRHHPEVFELDEVKIAGDTEIEKVALNDERKKIILKTLKNLPEQYQQVLSLRYFEDMSNEEMADILEISKETLAVKIHRALAAFKKALEDNNLLESLDITKN